MKTTLSPERLAELAAAGRFQASRSPFVDPSAAYQSKRLLGERGWEWAESVLMRRFTRRSIKFPELPFLEEGEMETLILAAEAEWKQLAEGVQ